MTRIILVFLSVFFNSFLVAQSFTNSTGGSIPDAGSTFTLFPVTVSGVGNINNTSGLKSLCFNIVHPKVSDIVVLLKAPNGTYIPLVTEAGVGSTDPDFISTCLTDLGTPIGFEVPPFTGNFLPQASLGWFNNNTNANGVWNLCIKDVNANNVGSLTNFTITFGASPVQYPVASCNGNLPASNFCEDAPLICNTNNYCGSTGDTYSSYSWPQLSAAHCSVGGQIFNNSFLKFVASATTATFNIRAFNSLSNDGISVLAFAGGCGSGSVTAKGCMSQIAPSSNQTVFTASSLTIGNTYYLMVDGKNGDANSYTVAAVTGVNFVSGAPTFASIPAICNGATPPNLPTISSNGIAGTWNPSVVSNTASGMYTFTPLAGQCSSTQITINIVVTANTIPTFNAIPSFCSSTTPPVLPTTSTNGFIGTWNPSVINNLASGTYTFSPNPVAGQCIGTKTINTTVTAGPVPTFAPLPAFCNGSTPPVLPTTSTNGFAGTWNPSVVNNTTQATYTFTPNTGQCASQANLQSTITAKITPTFNPVPPQCSGNIMPALQTTSNNGFVGTWNPSVINNMASGIYTFNPNAGQCANSTSIAVNITQSTVPTFSIIQTICIGGTAPTLPTTSNNGILGTWSPSVISNTTSGTYTFTPNIVIGQCFALYTLQVNVTAIITPTFTAISTLCSGSTAPVLPTTSTNSIAGTWSPSTVSNTASGTYTFTPNAGQCANTTTLSVSVTPAVTPTFTAIPALCSSSTAPLLPTTSTNSIVGTWSPSTVSNTASGTYTFTPNAGQCANTTTLSVSVTPKLTPTFTAIPALCSGSPAPVLPTTSTNSIVGTWSPSTVSNTASGTYTFTPNSGQCANTTTLSISVMPLVTPTFTAIPALCSGSTAPVLPTTSTNSIGGTWSPSTVSNTTSGTYTFTPNAGQCANTTTLSVSVTPLVNPTFTALAAICSGSTAPVLPTTSTNNIVGTWSPSVVSNTASGTYTFTPNAGQCANSTTLNISVTPQVTPTFTAIPALCNGSTAPVLPTTSTNNIIGTWSPSTVSNTASGTYTFTPNAGQCANTTTLNISVTPLVTPTFTAIPALCNDITAPILPTTSTNSIAGTWSPSTVSNTTSGTYIFTPNAGQCANSTTLSVSVTPLVNPAFTALAAICSGSTAPLLPITSTNGIVGTWSPSTVSNTASGTYTFTPNAGQCANSTTLNINVTPIVTPTFSIPTTISSGGTAPILPTTSNNGIVGTWNPNTVSNTTSGTYTFTPNVGQCAIAATLQITITSNIIPVFNITTTFCNGSVAQVLPTTSTNGIVGTWSPITVSNTTAGTYTFTPNSGQNATSITLQTMVTPQVTPTFTAIPALCSGSTAPILPTTSTNGIAGTWSPSTVSNTASGTYTFTPNAGQCANTTILSITVTPLVTPTFTAIPALCSGSTAPVLPTTSTNNIVGTWSPSTVSNTASGTYTFTPNAGQCANSTTLNISVNPQVTPTFTVIPALCSGSTAPVLPTTSTNSIGGTWSPSTVSNTASGTYTFTPNAGQCANTTTLNISVTPLVTPTFTAIPALCNGITAPILPTTSTNSIAGTWSPSTVSNTTSGSYIFTPNGGQCASNASITITVIAAPTTPTITFTGNTSFCTGGSILLTSSATINNQWYKDGLLISGATASTYNAVATGSYSVNTTTSNCVSVFSNNVSITVNAIPNAPFVFPNGTISACVGQPTTLTSSVTSGNQWYLNGNIITGATSNIYSAAGAGIYTVTTSSATCVSSASLGTTINIISTPAAPSITANGSTTFCAGSSVLLTSSATSNNQWYKNGIAIVGANNNTYSATTSGSYTVLFASGSCLSPQSSAINITVNAAPATPTLTAGGPTTFCSGGSVTLSSSLATSYQWYKDGILISGAIGNTYVVNTTGNYVVIIFQNGCYSVTSAPISVTVLPLPLVPVINAVGNVLTTTTGFTTYKWFLNNVLIPGAYTNTYTANTVGNYKVEVTNTNGCANTSTIYNHTSTGLNDIVLEGAKIQLMQNPADNVVTIKITNTISVKFNATLISASGKSITTKIMQNGINQIPVSGIASGFYVLRIVGSKKTQTLKIAIMH